jgi:hypothetical protein
MRMRRRVIVRRVVGWVIALLRWVVISLLGRVRRIGRGFVPRGRAGLAVIVVALLVEMLMGVPLVKKVRDCKHIRNKMLYISQHVF